MNAIRNKVVTLVALGAFLSPVCAFAQEVTVVGDPQAQMNTQQMIQAGQQDTNSTLQKLQDTGDDIIDALQKHAGQMTANTQAQTNAAANMADVKDQREVMRRIQDQKVRATNQVISGASVCNVITGAITAQNLNQQAVVWRSQAAAAALSYDEGILPNGQRGSQGALMDAYKQGHCKNGSTQELIDVGYCPSGSPVVKVPTDLNADTILKGSVLTPADNQAATQFMVAAYAGAPLPALPPGFDGNSEEGRRVIRARDQTLARSSVSYDIISGLIADRVAFADASGSSTAQGTVSNNNESIPGVSGGTGGGQDTTTLQGWAEATAQTTLGYNSAGNNFPNGVSKLGFMELRAKSWFYNPKWGVQLDGQGVDQTAKDLAMMQAFGVYQNWEQYRVLEQINMSLATIVSILQDNTRARL